MASIRVDHRGRGGAERWAGELAGTLVQRLAEQGHRLDGGAVPDVHLLVGAEPADGDPGLAVAVPEEADDPSLDLAARLHDLLPELPDEDPWPALPVAAFGARATCACRLAVPAARLGGGDPGVGAIAGRIAAAIAGHLRAGRGAWGFRAAGRPRRHADIWHEVPLVPQVTGMSCWAAAAAMVVGWRDQLYVDPAEIARGTGRWGAYADGLQPEDVAALARVWRLTIEPPRSYASADLEDLLRRHGPLWVGQADPDLHVICVVGVTGDGTGAGTLVRINDPWPPGVGERYSLTLGELAGHFRSASAMVGLHAQILHAGGRRTGE